MRKIIYSGAAKNVKNERIALSGPTPKMTFINYHTTTVSHDYHRPL